MNKLSLSLLLVLSTPLVIAMDRQGSQHPENRSPRKPVSQSATTSNTDHHSDTEEDTESDGQKKTKPDQDEESTLLSEYYESTDLEKLNLPQDRLDFVKKIKSLHALSMMGLDACSKKREQVNPISENPLDTMPTGHSYQWSSEDREKARTVRDMAIDEANKLLELSNLPMPHAILQYTPDQCKEIYRKDPKLLHNLITLATKELTDVARCDVFKKICSTTKAPKATYVTGMCVLEQERQKKFISTVPALQAKIETAKIEYQECLDRHKKLKPQKDREYHFVQDPSVCLACTSVERTITDAQQEFLSAVEQETYYVTGILYYKAELEQFLVNAHEAIKEVKKEKKQKKIAPQHNNPDTPQQSQWTSAHTAGLIAVTGATVYALATSAPQRLVAWIKARYAQKPKVDTPVSTSEITATAKNTDTKTVAVSNPR